VVNNCGVTIAGVVYRQRRRSAAVAPLLEESAGGNGAMARRDDEIRQRCQAQRWVPPDGMNWFEHEERCREAVEAGDLQASNELGLLLAEVPGRELEAEAAYRTALGAGSRNARNNLGRLLARLPGRADEAEELLQQAVESGDVFATNSLAVLLRGQRGRATEAEQAARESIARGDADGHNTLGILYLDAGRNEDALGEFVLATEGGVQRGPYNAGIACARLGRLAEAEVWYRQALAKGTDPGNTAGALAVLLVRLRRYEEAEQMAHQAVNAGTPLGCWALARLCHAQDDHETELQWMKSAEKMGAGWVTPLLAQMHLMNGRDAEAEAAGRRALAAAENDLAHAVVGAVALRKDDRESAILHLRRSGSVFWSRRLLARALAMDADGRWEAELILRQLIDAGDEEAVTQLTELEDDE
jgi:tetratricopeptide (TPR) repeat protein